jgi:hypothetical protein
VTNRGLEDGKAQTEPGYWYNAVSAPVIDASPGIHAFPGVARESKMTAGSVKTRYLAVSIFVIALFVRLGFAAVAPAAPGIYDNEMHRAARSLAATGVLSNPYYCQTGATAHVAPGYAAILALVYRFSNASQLWIIGLSAIVSSLTYALLPWLSGLLFGNIVIGGMAGLFGAFIPWLPGMEARGAWEVCWVACLLILAAGLTIRGSILIAGFVWGIAFLFGPALLPIFVVMAVFARKKVAAMILVASAVVAPWILRDYIQLGKAYWIRSNLGLELHVSNNPNAAADGYANLWKTSSFDFHPAHGNVGCAEIQKVGETAYMQTQMHQALSWIGSNPGPFARLTVLRIWYFWSPLYGSRMRQAATFIITLLAFAGAVLAIRNDSLSRGLFIGAFAAFPTTYYMIQADARYRAPVQPLLLLAASYAVAEAFHRLQKDPGAAAKAP